MATMLAMQAYLRRVRGLTRTRPGRLQTHAGPASVCRKAPRRNAVCSCF